MKKILLLLLLAPTFVNAQESEIKVTSEGISSLVIQTEGLTAIQLYDKSKMFVLKMFDDPKDVIKVDELGKIIRFDGYQNFKGGISSEGKYKYTCELEFKEGRYKISFYNVYLDKINKQTYKDLFNKEGQLRKLEFYQNVHANFVVMLNGVNSLIKESILKKASEDKW